MNKVIRDGKVAVLISGGFGAGWYTWNTEFPDCLTNPQLVALVEKKELAKDRTEAIALELGIESCARQLYGGGFYTGGVDGLRIHWVPSGTQFEVDEYDGSESLKTRCSLTLTA